MEVWEEGHVEKIRTIVRQAIFEKNGIMRLLSRRSDCPAEQGEWARRIQLLNEECETLRRKMQLSA